MKANIIILLFLYVYPLFFMGIPLSTRIIFGVIGGAMFIFKKVHSAKEWYPLLALLPIMSWSVFVALINNTLDFFFLFYGISILLIYFASVFIVNRIRSLRISSNALDLLLSAFVIVVLIQSFFAITFFFFPQFQEICLKLFPLTEREMSAAEGYIGSRFIGLGSSFFGAGVIHGLALITMGYLYIAGRVKSKSKWILSYLIIVLSGLMLARTTIIGFGFSLLLIFSWKPFSKNTFKRILIFIICFLVVSIVVILLLLKYMDEAVLRFAFELVYNYIESGSFESASTNRLQEMYGLPEFLGTYFVGDGLYNLKSGGYYMSTDVGYMRLLYYGGIPMVIFYFYFQWNMMNNIIKLGSVRVRFNRSVVKREAKATVRIGVTKQIKRYLQITFLYLIVLNFKGFTDLAPYYLLFYIVMYNNIKIYKSKAMTSVNI